MREHEPAVATARTSNSITSTPTASAASNDASVFAGASALAPAVPDPLKIDRGHPYRMAAARRHQPPSVAPAAIVRGLLGRELDRAAHDDVRPEGDIAADDEPRRLAQRRRTGREALLEAVEQPVVRLGQLDVRQRIGGGLHPELRGSGGRRPSAAAADRRSSSPARSASAAPAAARRPVKLPIAAPIALSSWITGVESESRGSTVLRLTISGSSRTPSALVERARERAQVDPQAVRVVVAPAADSRGRTPRPRAASAPSRAARAGRRSRRRAMWPPLRSASVPSTTSIRNGISLAATCSAMRGSNDRPEVVGVGDHRVVEAALQQRGQHARAPQRAVDVAVARAGTIRAPGPAGQLTGRERLALELGDHALQEVERQSLDRQLADARRAPRASGSWVASESISTSGRRMPWRSRSARIWPTMICRNVPSLPRLAAATSAARAPSRWPARRSA